MRALMKLPLYFVSLGLLFPAVSLAQQDSVRLTMQLDGDQYLVDQPILALVCVENMGQTTYEDVPTLYPGDGYLRLSLTREGDNEAQSMSGMLRDVLLTGKGIAISAGKSQCEAVDLLDWYGEFTREPTVTGQTGLHLRLPPGKYRLGARLNAHTGLDPAVRSPRLLESNVVEFRIGAREAQSLDRSLDGFLQDPRSQTHGDEYRRYCNEWLPRAYRSPHFISLYYGAGISSPATVPVDSILSGLASARVNPVRIASVIWMYSFLSRDEDKNRLAWVKSLGPRFRDSRPIEQVVQTWEARLDQRRYYHSHRK